jgi:hypothetical protein
MYKVRIAAIAIFCAISINASTLLSISNDSGGAYEITNQSLSYQISQSVEFTLAQTFTDVTISGIFTNRGSEPGTATAYLTETLGSTAAALETNTVSVPYPCTSCPAQGTIFSGLTLLPGTYYVVLGDPAIDSGNNIGWEAALPNAALITTAAGVTYNGHQQSFSNTNYPPGGSYSNASQALLLTITGNAAVSSVPEPRSWTLAGGVLLLLIVGSKQQRKFSSQ